MQRLTDQEAVILYSEIIIQAVSDYKELLKKGKKQIKNKNTGTYGLTEIEDFFLGEWGESIIQDGLRLRRMDGSDFLKAASA